MSYFYKDTRLAGMGQKEAFIWSKFLEDKGSNYFNFFYNFRLRRPLNLPKDFPDNLKSMALHGTSFRIDAYSEDKSNIYIFEVRPSATHSAIGTLIMYKFLFHLQENPQKPVILCLVTDTFDASIEFTCRQVGILYFVY